MVDLLGRARTFARGMYINVAWRPDGTHTLVDELERRASRHPDAPMLVFEGQRWSYGELNAEVNRAAHAWRQAGVGRGDVVALMMSNRPQFLFHLYGLGKLGAIASLINPNLAGPALAFAISSCTPRAMVAGTEMLEALDHQAVADVVASVPRYLDDEVGDHAPVEGWSSWRPSTDSSNPVLETPRLLGDVFAYIYTSGTTGKPKPAIVKHHRFWRAGSLIAAGLLLEPNDALYDCLPLYHANGVMLAASSVIAAGARLVLARKFSASRFWDDVVDSGATHFIYIGEVCRYLLGSPPHPKENAHNIRVIVGNGLRPEVWDPFKDRFGIPRIIEFYGSTEGNAETANLLGTSGSCGMLLPGRMALVRYDVESDTIVRGPRGFCERVAAGEPGLLLGKIQPKNEFAGYTDAKASATKVLRDVFKKGDAWFNTGDLLRRDRWRRLYFVDRLGDTFRWKGENVATTDVAEALSRVPGIREATVYGVPVPHAEGRAGMAAVVVEPEFDMGALFTAIADALPGYAQPRFVRLVDRLEVTGTFKHRKGELQREGVDPMAVEDPLYVRDGRARAYVALSDAHRAAIDAGTFAL